MPPTAAAKYKAGSELAANSSPRRSPREYRRREPPFWPESIDEIAFDRNQPSFDEHEDGESDLNGASSQWYFASMGLTNSVHPYWRLATLAMQMTPRISCTHGFASARLIARNSNSRSSSSPYSRMVDTQEHLGITQKFRLAGDGGPDALIGVAVAAAVGVAAADGRVETNSFVSPLNEFERLARTYQPLYFIVYTIYEWISLSSEGFELRRALLFAVYFAAGAVDEQK